jgi:hypothetical protein
MKIIVRNVRYISKTAEIIANKCIIRFNPFGVGVIMADVENLGLLNFRNQTFPESIPGMIFNIFDVEYKVEAISNTEQNDDETSKISEKIDFISENDIEEYDFSFQSLKFFDIGHADAIISRI